MLLTYKRIKIVLNVPNKYIITKYKTYKYKKLNKN